LSVGKKNHILNPRDKMIRSIGSFSKPLGDEDMSEGGKGREVLKLVITKKNLIKKETHTKFNEWGKTLPEQLNGWK